MIIVKFFLATVYDLLEYGTGSIYLLIIFIFFNNSRFSSNKIYWISINILTCHLLSQRMQAILCSTNNFKDLLNLVNKVLSRMIQIGCFIFEFLLFERIEYFVNLFLKIFINGSWFAKQFIQVTILFSQ